MSTDILSSSRRLRRKKALVKAALVAFVIFIFIVGIVIFFNLPKFRINEIAINGEKALDKEEFLADIREILKERFLIVFPLDNIFIFPKTKISDEALNKFPILKKISIERDFPNKIIVSVEERKASALWCKHLVSNISLSAQSASSTEADKTESSFGARECAFSDENGFIFSQAPDFSGGIFLKFFDERVKPAEIGKQMLEEGEFKKLIAFYDLAAKKDFSAANVALKDGGVYEVYLKEGWYILLNDKNNPDSSLDNLKIVLEQIVKEKRPRLEYIDIRFGNKIFYKLK